MVSMHLSNENRLPVHAPRIEIFRDGQNFLRRSAQPQVPHSHHSCPLSPAMLTSKFAYLWEMYTLTPLMESSFTETEMDEWVLELG